MKKDKAIVWAWIAGLALLIVAQIVGNAMMNHWKAKDAKYSHPDPMFERLGGKR